MKILLLEKDDEILLKLYPSKKTRKDHDSLFKCRDSEECHKILSFEK